MAGSRQREDREIVELMNASTARVKVWDLAIAMGTDPHPDNGRAIRVYEHAGFKLVDGPWIRAGAELSLWNAGGENHRHKCPLRGIGASFWNIRDGR